MTEEQNGNGRRPVLVETTEPHTPHGYTIYHRGWRINPFDREREPVKYWLFSIGGGIISIVVAIVVIYIVFIFVPS